MAGKKITGRTKQLSLKATPQFHQRLKVLASKEKCLMIEVLEEALKLYEEVRKERKKAVKETVPQVSQEKVTPNAASKHSRDHDGTVEEPNTSSKKRKIYE